MLDQSELDHVTAQIARLTDRNVTLDDLSGKVLSHHSLNSRLDRGRIDAILLKRTPEEVLRREESIRAEARSNPLLIPAAPELDLFARICVPMQVRGILVAYAWILANDDDDDLHRPLESLRANRAALDRLSERVMLSLGSAVNPGRPEETEFAAALRRDSGQAGERLEGYFADHGPFSILAFDAAHTARLALPELAYTQSARDTAARMDLSVLVHADTQLGVCLLPAETDAARFVDMVDAAMAARIAATGGRLRIRSGSSLPFADLHEIARALRQAITTLQASAIDDSLTGRTYSDIGIYHYIARIGSWEPSARWVRLAASPSSDDWMRLLERIYDSNLPMQTVADGLHMHRSSIYNHLRRIHSWIGADPLDPQVQLEIHMGLKAQRWRKRTRYRITDQ